VALSESTPDGNPVETGINEFALVIYVPGPLGPYLDRMRQRVAPWMPPGRSHVTILQPRPISKEPADVWSALFRRTALHRPFMIEPSGVDVFGGSGVIHLGIETGANELGRLHLDLNKGGVSHAEPYPFHPHITIAQGLEGVELERAVETCQRLWDDYEGPRSFRVQRFYFVQNTVFNLWMDLAEMDLRGGGDWGQN